MKKMLVALFAAMMVFGGSFPASAAVAPDELEKYLQEVQLSESEFESYLASYDLTVEDFEDIEEIREVLGPRVTTESLNQLLEDYGMTREELESLLSEYGELEAGAIIEDSFLFISDIEDYILLEEEWNEVDEEIDQEFLAELAGIFGEIGITEEEMANLSAHLDRVMDDPAALEQLELLSYRMMEFGEFETLDELTPDQLAELLAIAEEFKQLAQLEFSFYLVKDGTKTPISFESLLAIEDADGASLLIEVYDLDGNLLLDAVLTGETINSDLITETGETITDVTQDAAKPSEKQASTIKGGVLPDTAGNYGASLLFGAGLLGAAALLMRKLRTVK